MRRSLLFLAVALLVLAVPSVVLGDCSSNQCTDCGEDAQKRANCIFVYQDAFCVCDLFIFGGTLACGVDGLCDYTAGGTDTGGGGGGGGGSTCLQLPGSWCPAECQSCESVYWY
jgi:hypothetical protein